VDIEKDPEIASEYGIMSIPTILAIKNGKEIKRKVGSMQEIDFVIWLNELK
jgi:thioredoxin-like negative regulator of GroEL